MNPIPAIQKKLDQAFFGVVTATLHDDIIRLTGTLGDWDDVVRAGMIAAKRKPKKFGLVNDVFWSGGAIPQMRIPPLQDNLLEGKRPDVLIIGGGVVGCAIARECARYDLNVVLCEKEHDVGMHASSRNDGMIHPGIDLLPGQVKRKYNMRGNAMYDSLCAELDVPFRRSGQYLCMASSPHAIIAFLSLAYFKTLGPTASFVGKRALHAREPHLSNKIKGALFFPAAGVVSPYALTIALAENAADNGVTIALDTAVTGMRLVDRRIVDVVTNRGTLHPRVVINAAGVFADDVAKLASDRFFSIHPRRGTNAILDAKATARLGAIASIYGTSSTKKRHTKGGGLVHTADGNLLVGPDAFETPEKENFDTNAQSIHDTFEKQRHTDAALTEREIITYFTGVRASTYEEDFIIEIGRKTSNIVHAAGIQSPGLTAAPAIAADVAKMAVSLVRKERTVDENPCFDPHRVGIPHTASMSDEARAALIGSNPDFGEIVCRCEQISRGEIIAALHRSVPCDTIDGVKRRVRAGMGRCQGGFCGPQVVQIISNERNIPLESVRKSGLGSELLLCKNKEENAHGNA